MVAGICWHLPGNAEPADRAGMRSPVFPTDPTQPITIFSGSFFQGGQGAANQLQDGSVVVYRMNNDAWKSVPMTFAREIGNNKYFKAEIPAAAVGTKVQYYLVLAYDSVNQIFY